MVLPRGGILYTKSCALLFESLGLCSFSFLSPRRKNLLRLEDIVDLVVDGHGHGKRDMMGVGMRRTEKRRAVVSWN